MTFRTSDSSAQETYFATSMGMGALFGTLVSCLLLQPSQAYQLVAPEASQLLAPGVILGVSIIVVAIVRGASARAWAIGTAAGLPTVLIFRAIGAPNQHNLIGVEIMLLGAINWPTIWVGYIVGRAVRPLRP
jgi:hypothetical protein